MLLNLRIGLARKWYSVRLQCFPTACGICYKLQVSIFWLPALRSQPGYILSSYDQRMRVSIGKLSHVIDELEAKIVLWHLQTHHAVKPLFRAVFPVLSNCSSFPQLRHPLSKRARYKPKNNWGKRTWYKPERFTEIPLSSPLPQSPRQ